MSAYLRPIIFMILINRIPLLSLLFLLLSLVPFCNHQGEEGVERKWRKLMETFTRAIKVGFQLLAHNQLVIIALAVTDAAAANAEANPGLFPPLPFLATL